MALATTNTDAILDGTKSHLQEMALFVDGQLGRLGESTTVKTVFDCLSIWKRSIEAQLDAADLLIEKERRASEAGCIQLSRQILAL
jgi:hypothetical protein